MPGRDKTTKQGKTFFKQIDELKKLQVRVGFTAAKRGYGQRHENVSADDEDGVTIAEIAAWNELGTYNIPPRPFLRQSVDNNRDNIRAMCKEAMSAIVEGKATAQKALAMLGALQVGLVQSEIKRGGFEPNARITVEGGWMRNKKSGKAFYVKGKKSAQPLIDTGRMRQSVHYVIEGGD
jgi:hypothetical protein